MKVWIYVDSRKQVGDEEHLKVFASANAANAWFEENDLEGVAFEYPVMKGRQLRRPCCMKSANTAKPTGIKPTTTIPTSILRSRHIRESLRGQP